MNICQILIIIGGILSLFIGIFHTRFYKLFTWGIEFEKIGLTNNKIFYTIHIALLLFFFIFSVVSFVYFDELSRGEGVAFGIMLLYSLFWLWRTLWQIFYFKPSNNRRLRKLYYMHYLLIVWFFLLFIVYFIPVVIKLMNVKVCMWQKIYWINFRCHSVIFTLDIVLWLGYIYNRY